MTEAERRLVGDRKNRNAARTLVDKGVKQVKADLSARGIGGRIKDSALQEAEEAVHIGIAVARENKPVVAGTIGLLLVWFLRNPLGRRLGRIFGSKSEAVHDLDDNVGPDQE
jgi:hypothetical protein